MMTLIVAAISTPSIFMYIAPRVLLTTVLIYLVSDYSESLIAKFRNIWAEIRLWPGGFLSLILTGFCYTRLSRLLLSRFISTDVLGGRR